MLVYNLNAYKIDFLLVYLHKNLHDSFINKEGVFLKYVLTYIREKRYKYYVSAYIYGFIMCMRRSISEQ